MTRSPDDDDSWLEGVPSPRGGGRRKTADPAEADPAVTDKPGLAKLLGAAPKEIDKMIRDGLPVHGERSRGVPIQFSVPACVQWMLARAGDSEAATKRRIDLAVARKREAEAGKLEDDFIETKIVETAIRDAVAKFQAELQAIPARLPPEVRELAKVEINGAINRLARQVQP